MEVNDKSQGKAEHFRFFSRTLSLVADNASAAAATVVVFVLLTMMVAATVFRSVCALAPAVVLGSTAKKRPTLYFLRRYFMLNGPAANISLSLAACVILRREI